MYLTFTTSLDNIHIKRWLSLRSLNPGEADSLPEIGYIAWERGEPIAAGYIRRVEGGFGLLDSLITNPEAPGDMRSGAIDLVVQALLDNASNAKLERLLAYSVDDNTITRSARFGFLRLPHAVLSIDLSKKA